MATNSTACVVTGNCTINDGTITNGTFYISGTNGYNPNAPVVRWRQRMEISAMAIAGSLTLMVIAARTWYRWRLFKRLRSDDKWMLVAGFCVLGYMISQIGLIVRGGSGLHIVNVTHGELLQHFYWQFGWTAYYAANSCIKMSVCFCFLEILPCQFRKLRYSVYGLAAFITLLGLACGVSWLIQCVPFLSNFLWSVTAEKCVNYDVFRWLWFAGSLVVDCLLMLIPWEILRRSNMKGREARILQFCFAATLLGTLTCICNVYGILQTRTSQVYDFLWKEASYLTINNIELLMYTIGASVPVLSRYFVNRGGPDTRDHRPVNFSSWARGIPNFFTTRGPQTERTINMADQAEPPARTRSDSDLHGGLEFMHEENEVGEIKRMAVINFEKGEQSPSIDTQELTPHGSEDGLIIRDPGNLLGFHGEAL